MAARLGTVCLAMAASLWGPGATAQEQLVLGLEGTVFQLHEGTYGELFPEGFETAAENPVLALDVVRADGATERWLVPGTESSDSDGSASIVFEKSTGVYIVWETWFNGLHPILNLTSFDGSAWNEVIEIVSGPFALKGSPKLVVTREKGRGVEAGDLTTLHLIWWQEASGISLKRYAPVFIQGGEYKGWSPVIDLSTFMPTEDDPELLDVPGLENALCISPGKDDRTVVVGFLNPQTHRLSTVELEVLPLVLGNLADEARAHIVIFGTYVSTHAELAQTAADRMLELGSPFHEATLGYMTDQVRHAIESSAEDLTADGIASIADKARAHIVIFGAQFGPDGLANGGESQILEVGQSASGGAPYQYIKVTPISDRVAPEVGGPAELILSESGESVIVAWEADGLVHYRESQGEGWSEISVIELTENLDRESVRRMLGDYVRAE